MGWALIGGIAGTIVTLIGVIAGLVQILQYLEERKHIRIATNPSLLVQQEPARELNSQNPATPAAVLSTTDENFQLSEPLFIRRIDFVLITALIEERDAVLDKLPGYRKAQLSKDDIRTYFSAELPVTLPNNSTGLYHIVVMSLLGMGRVQAATATADAIHRWHPRYVLLVGIAGCIANRDVKIGDILISDQIVDYELQKLTPQGPEVRWEVFRSDPRLLDACNGFGNEGWKSLMKVNRPGRGEPKRHIGPIASGDKVVAFSEVLDKYRDMWPKLIGVEMEAAGVATAAVQSSENPGFFMVRGVSDMADEKKGVTDVKKWRLYACDVAASFMVAFLKSGPIPLSEREEKLIEQGPGQLSVSSNLPPREIIIGREEERKILYEAVKSGYRLIVIDGMGGIGKTVLALDVAYKYLNESLAAQEERHHEKEQFKAVIWVTAKTGSINLDNVLDTVARTLDYPYIMQLETEEKLYAVFRLFRRIKILIIIDNFETIQDERVVEFVRNLPDPSKVLITTRYQKAWNGEDVISLGKLTLEDGLGFIASEGRRQRIDSLIHANRDLLENLYEATGGSPLAIRWAVGQIKQRGRTLESILNMLENAQGDIFKTMFAEAWSLLSDGGRQILITMPLFADTVSRIALEKTVDIHPMEFDKSLGQLVELWLLESNLELLDGKSRFGVHPLTRAFIGQELSNHPVLEQELRWRAANYYQQLCDKQRHSPDMAQGYDEIDVDVKNILRSIEWLHSLCSTDPPDSQACKLLVALSETITFFFWNRGYWAERVSLCKHAIEACKILGDWENAGRQAWIIGSVRVWQGQVSEAEKWAIESMTFMERTGSPLNIAIARELMGVVMMWKGDYEQAGTLFDGVLRQIMQPGIAENEQIKLVAGWEYFGPQSHKIAIESLYQHLGILATMQNDNITALKWFDAAITLGKQIGDTEGLSVSLSHLGRVLFSLGRNEEAKAVYTEGLELATRAKRKSTLGRCNQGLATLASVEDRGYDVIRYGQAAIDIFERLGMQVERGQVENLTFAKH